MITDRVKVAIVSLICTVVGTVSAFTPIPTLDMTRTNEFSALHAWDFAGLFPIVMSVYSDPMGENGKIIVYGSILVTILAGLAIRQDDVLIPMVILEIFGQVFYWGGFIPPEWGIWVIGLLYVLPATGIIYSLYATKRKG